MTALLVAALSLYPKMGRDFLPAFHEETVILTTGAAPGTSMTEMEQLGTAIERQLRQIPEINHIGRRIGRAERSDHVMPDVQRWSSTSTSRPVSVPAAPRR